jgi:hypothetical protein
MPKRSKEEFVERATGWMIDSVSNTYRDPKLAEEARERMSMEDVYRGKSKRLHRMVRLAYLRGMRRGAYSVWEGQQPIVLRSK